MFHEKNSTIHGNEDEPNKLSKIKKKKQNIQSNGFHGDKHSMINPVQRKLGNSTVTSGSRTNNKTERITNGSTSKCTDVIKKDISFKTSTAIYKRTRSHLRIAGNTNGFNDCGLGADVDESTRSSLGKSKKRPRDTNGSVLKEDDKRKDHPNIAENAEQLLEAILAIYGMSNVAEVYRPRVPKLNKKIDEQMTEEMFKICPTVKRIGYRYRTFYIYAVQPLTLKEEKIRNNKIRMVLEKYEIFPFKIAQCGEKNTRVYAHGAKNRRQNHLKQCISFRSKTVFKIFKKAEHLVASLRQRKETNNTVSFQNMLPKASTT
ncbi:uncharacterized protein LOC132759913 [Ruditapes philippinarum]|uniref:uncharacterized protein LOC132759913 n=1 Tax=Ruditapes philippinarum TaxID=129788 RepID=UPI00295AD61C|nr:uncharacterized protein LOC132759913 [Ruditapes philippinarum]